MAFALVVYDLALASVPNAVQLAAWKIGELAGLFTAWDITILPILWTLAMSSLLFFDVSDAAIIAATFLVSTIVCRLVLEYELAGIKTVAGGRDLVEGTGRGEEASLGGKKTVV